MAGPMDVKAEVEFVLKDQGITAAVGKIKELETAQKKVTAETQRTAEATGAFGGALRSIGAYAASFLAAGSIISFLRSSQREFIEAEKSAVRLKLSLKLLGDEYASSFNEVSAYADEMERLTGIDADVIRSAQSVLVTIGRLSGETLNRATRAALDLSVALGTDLNNAAMIIAKAGAGAEGALGRMGIRIDETVPPSERLEAILEALEKRVGGVAQEMGETLPGAAQRAATAFDNLWESVGGLFTTTEGISLWTAALEKMKSALDGLKKFSDSYSDWFVAIFGFGAGSGTPFPGVGSAPGYGPEPFKPDMEVNVSLKDADAKAKQREEIEAKARAEREKEEAKLEERIAENRLAQFKRTVEEELRENGKALDARAEPQAFFDETNESVFKQLDERKKVEDQILEIVFDSARQELEARNASLEEQWRLEKNYIERTVTNEKLKNAKLLALDEEYNRKKAALAKYTAEVEKMATLDAVIASTEMLGAVFGEKKGFAIALALMNTFRAVTAALAEDGPGPARYASAAAALAMGMAQVARIRSTNLGSSSGSSSLGGGSRGGENFARSASPSISMGDGTPYTQQGAAVGGQSTTYDHRTGMVINFNGTVVGGKAGVTELYRLLDQEGRKQRSRLVR